MPAQTVDQPARVRVDYEAGLFCDIENDVVGRFLSNPVDFKQPAAQINQVEVEKICIATPLFLHDHPRERPEFFCFGVVVPR